MTSDSFCAKMGFGFAALTALCAVGPLWAEPTEEITGNAFSMGLTVNVAPFAPPRDIAGMAMHKASGWYDGARLELFATIQGYVPALEIGQSEGAWMLRADEAALPVGTWRQLAATWDGRVARLYVGARLVAEGRFSGRWTPPRNAGQGGVGCGRAAFGLQGFPMQTKDAFLVNAVLSPDDLRQRAGAEAPVDETAALAQRRLFGRRTGFLYQPTEADRPVLEAERSVCGVWPVGPALVLPEGNAPLCSGPLAFHVAPRGDDRADGSRTRPFATLRRARDAVRALRKGAGLPKGGVSVVVEDGVYPVRETLAFTSEDAGTPDSPVLWCAAPGAHPVLDGGFRVRGLEPVTDPAVRARLAPAAAEHVRVADLRAQGYQHFEPLPQYGMEVGESAGEKPMTDLYRDGARLELARDPNDGWLTVGGGDATTGVVRVEKADLPRWTDEREVFYVGYPAYLWADWAAPVRAINPEAGEIALPPRPNGKFPVRFVAGHPYFLANALAALDREGEWFLDRAAGRLYVWATGEELVLSDFSAPFVTFQDVTDFEWRGISLRHGRASACVAERCARLTISGCEISRFGNDGLRIRAGRDVTVRDNRLVTFGHGAIRASGGDRERLAPAGIVIERNEIAFVEQWKRTYAPGLLLYGCGAHVRHNHFHDMRSSAMRLEGNDFLIASNLVEDVVLESDDQGGIDIYANPTYAIRIVGNTWRRIGRGGPFVRCGQAGVRFDDAVSNMLVADNRFEACGFKCFGAVQINGGRNNTIVRNVFVDCPRAVSVGAWRQARWEKFVNRPDWLRLMTNEPYASRYPGLSGLGRAPQANRIWCNTVIGEGGLCNLGGSKIDARANVAFATEGDAEAFRAAGETARIVDFDDGWEFALKDFRLSYGKTGLASPQNNANDNGTPRVRADRAGWTRVRLPHDWALALPYAERGSRNGFRALGAGFPTNSVGWYRKTFAVPVGDASRRTFIRFDGVYRDAQFWMNGVYLGRNASGYIGRTFDVTDMLRYGETNNFVCVRVDASVDEGWWYDGAGICRHVTLEVKGRDGLVPDSAFIRLQEMRGADAVMAVDYETLETGAHHETFTVKNARLWSPDDPCLHTREIRGETIRYGIRTVRFDPNVGLTINGRRVEVRGVCCHQDHAGVGVAVPDAIVDYRVRRLKSLGVNAWRTSHNPPSTALLDACDRHGIMVMDETRFFSSSAEGLDQFSRMVRRDRNHPSVVAYSLGNEEHNVQNGDTGRRMAATMKARARRLDPTRPVTYGGNNGATFAGVNEVVDVRGVNYIRLMNVDSGGMERYHADHPLQSVWGSEEASTLCTRGVVAPPDARHRVMPDGDAPRNRPLGWSYGAEDWTSRAAERAWFAGAFVWTGFDYRGECNWPAVNCNFGVLDLCGFEKNNASYYRARWTDRDVLRVYPHANAPATNFYVNTNCDRVELVVNGRSAGVKTRPAGVYRLSFPVDFRAGTVEARGVRDGREVRFGMATSGPTARLALEADRATLEAGGRDATVVNVTARDAAGREVFDAGERLSLRVTGAGEILGVGNGDPTDHDADLPAGGVASRRLFNGKCQAIVRAGMAPGDLVLVCALPSGGETRLVIPVRGAGAK